ncbi:hypothetical protein QCA50_011137 [Cerrena zonata]|uniref:Uncharacterized protein n=1 Tax=Cerrena zonata TaxID=2478898 RepID=A0AAW0FXY8_9APHY
MWRVPDLVHLSETDFVGSLKLGLNHDVHFLRWTLNSSTSLPRHAQFSSYIETDESDEEEFISTFKAHFDLSSSPIHALIIAHEESFEIEESRPNTTIRSIDPTTFELNWCTPFEQNMLAMGVYEPLNLLVMIGNGHTSRYINLIDIKTGAVCRRDEMNMDNDVSKIHISSQGELVATNREGAVTVMRISDITEHGYATVLANTTGKFAVSRISCPNPALAAGEVQKDDTRMEVKYWMQGASLLGDGMVLLGDHDSIRYVIASWR